MTVASRNDGPPAEAASCRARCAAASTARTVASDAARAIDGGEEIGDICERPRRLESHGRLLDVGRGPAEF